MTIDEQYEVIKENVPKVYEAGYHTGYTGGKKDENEKTDVYVQRSKKAIIGRGGTISSDAGIEDLPDAIFNIPADASLAHYTDDDIAYRKNVPVGSAEYALLKSVGGMTYKSNNLIPFPYVRMNSTENGVNFSTNDDGAISLNGTSNSSNVSNIALINSSAPITFEAGTYTFRQNRSNTDSNAYMVWAAKEEGANTQYLYEDVVKTFSKPFTLWCAIQIKGNATVNTVFRPMFYKGTATLPYERFFEGLRDSKVTEIVSVGANLLSYPYAQTTKTEDGITFTDNGDGSVTLNGTATATFFVILSKNIKVEDGTYTVGKISNASNKSGVYAQLFYKASDGSYPTWNVSNQPVTLTLSKDIAYSLQLVVEKGITVSNVTVYPMLNGGSTAAPYVPYRDEPIATKPIPKALQDLDGWGRGIESAHNYADFENEQFAELVGVAVFDGSTDELWYATSSLNKTDYNAFYIRQYATNGHKSSGGVAICDKLSLLTVNELYQQNVGGFYMGDATDKQIIIRVPNSIADVTALRTWLSQNPLTVYYELAEPIITDISDILTDDNFIEVESGGTLEFVNEYQNAVPSTVKYTVKVGS